MFPLVIIISSVDLENLTSSEEGRHEDSMRDGEGPCPTFEVCRRAVTVRRHRRALVVATAEEAADLYYAACSGTFQLTALATARRIADALRDIVRVLEPGTVNLWRAPSGS